MDHHPKNVISVIELPKTKEFWETYRKSEASISEFLKVLKSCIEETSENSSKLISTDSIIAEVEFFLDNSSSDLFSSLLPLIKESKRLLFDRTSYTDRSLKVGMVLCQQLDSFLDEYSTNNIEKVVQQGFEVIDFLFKYSKNVIEKESKSHESEKFWDEFKNLKEKILNIVPQILMKNEPSPEIFSSLLDKIKEFELTKEKLSVVGQDSFRMLLKKFGDRSLIILESYLPRKLDNPDLIDIKNLLKFVYINPEYIQRSFEILMDLFRQSSRRGSSYQIEKHKFRQEIECRELSFLLKFSVSDPIPPSTILKLTQGPDCEISFECENSKLFFIMKRLDKDQKPQKEEIQILKPHQSLTLVYNHSQLSKIPSIQINQKSFPDRFESLKKFDRLSSLQINFSGTLDFLAIFNKSNSIRDLDSSNLCKILEVLTEKPDPLIFLAAPEGEDLIRENFLKLSGQPNNLYEIFKKLGGINWMIPLFNQTENSENFAYLFYILKEFVASMDPSQVPELFNEEFFQSLQVLMARQIKDPCEKMVASLLEFVHVIKNLDVLKVVIENLLFNEELWVKVENHSVFIMAFNSMLEIKKEVFQKIFDKPEKILKLVQFFINVNKENQAFISSYLFKILEEMDDFFCREHQVLLSVMKLVVEKMSTEAEGQHFRNFLLKISHGWREKSKISKLEKFDCLSFCDQIIDSVFPGLIRNKENFKENGLEYPVIAFILDVFSENIYMYRRDPITQRVIDFKIDYSKEKEFYNKLYKTLENMRIDLNKLDLLDVFCKFSEKSLVKNIMLYSAPSNSSVINQDRKSSFFFDLVTNQLFTFHEITKDHPVKFAEVLNYIEILMKNNAKLFIKIVESSCFPEWSYPFFEKYEKHQIENFYLFFLKIFTETKYFKNFNSLRKLVFWFQERKRYKDGLEFLASLVCDLKIEESLNSDLMLLVEFLNVFEDVSSDYSINPETFETYKKITLSLFEICKKHDYSLSFPQVSLVMPLLRKLGEKSFEKSIIFRDGGFIRQLLLFSFKIMREKIDFDIENCIIQTFCNKGCTNKEEEWKKIKNSRKNNKDKNSNKISEKCISKSPIPSKNRKLSLKSFLVLYIYFEWADCIERQTDNPRKLESQERLVKFLSQNNFNGKEMKKRLIECLKQWLSDMKEAYKFPDQWSEKIKPYKYSFEINSTTDLKDKRIEEKLDNFSSNFPKDNFEMFKVIKDEQLHFYIFYCTSLKMELISKYYKIETRSHPSPKEESFESRKSSIDSMADLKRSSMIQNELIYKTTLKRYQDIFNPPERQNEKLVLRSLRDSQGRCVFIQKSVKNSEFLNLRKKSSIDSLSIQSMNLSKASPKNSFGSVDLMSNHEEDISTNQSFYPLSSPKTIEVECELIKIYGSLSGSLKISENDFLFKTKQNYRQESPFTSYPGKKIKVFRASFQSTSLPFKNLNKIWLKSEVTEAVPKTLMHVKSGFELKFSSGKAKLFNFYTTEDFLLVQRQLKAIDIPVVENLKYAKHAKHLWKKGELSNFRYLLMLNEYSGRSFNNLTQYPVFPWVLKNYSGDSIDLNDKNSYRDLEFPIGAQEEFGRSRCKKKYEISKQEEKIGYHHGSHYSNAGIVLHFMLRIEPFSQQAKNLQGGNFDLPDRLFQSLEQAWKSSQACFGDCKELVPEMFYLPEIFQNKNRYDFKKRQDGKIVDEVELPPWTKGSIYKFLQIHQKALESDIVSQKLPDWINLIFGYKQRDSEARDSFNLFHPVTYDDKYRSFLKEYEESFHSALSQQVFHFGQTPQKLFTKSHGLKKELFRKASLSERLLKQEKVEPQKIFSAEVRALLISSNVILILKVTESKSLKLVKITLNERGNELAKEFEIFHIRNDPTVLSCLFNDNQIVLANSKSNCLFFYSFSGELKQKTRLFHSEVICLAGNSIVAAGCSDSSLVIVKENSKKLQLFGHFEPIKEIVISEEYCSVISCSRKMVLVHDFRTGNILNKIETQVQKVACNAFGLVFVGSDCEVKVFFINGDVVRRLDLQKNCQWGSLGDCVWIKSGSQVRIEDPYFEDEARIISSKVSDWSFFCYHEKNDIAVFAVDNDIYKIS